MFWTLFNHSSKHVLVQNDLFEILSNLNIFHTFSSNSTVDCEQVNVCWDALNSFIALYKMQYFPS